MIALHKKDRGSQAEGDTAASSIGRSRNNRGVDVSALPVCCVDLNLTNSTKLRHEAPRESAERTEHISLANFADDVSAHPLQSGNVLLTRDTDPFVASSEWGSSGQTVGLDDVL